MATTAELTEAGTGKTVQLGGSKIHYQEAGRGDPIVFLHSYGPGTTGWINFHKNFVVLSKHYRCILLDLPATGRTVLSPVPDENGHSAAARTALTLMDALGIEKANLVGNSMGGTSVLVFAINHPERLKKIVVGACHASTGGNPYLIANRPPEGIKATREASENPTRENFLRYLSIHLDNQALVTDELVDYIHQVFTKSREGAPRRTGGQQVPHDNLPDLHKIKAPTLIIQGRYDRMVPVEVGLTLLNYISDSRLVVFNHCGHWPPYEYPEEYNAQVLSFLKA